MTPTQDAPAAQSEETQLPATSEPGSEAQATAAAANEQQQAQAPQEDPEVKKLRDRLAEQGRKNAQLVSTQLQMNQEIAGLRAQFAAVTPFLSQLQQSQERARLAQMEPEQQIAYLNDKIAHIQRQPAPMPVVDQPDPQRDVVLALVDQINGEYGLDGDLTAEEIGVHPTREAWEKAARAMARAKASERGTEVPAKKADNNQPAATSAADIQKMIDQAVARATGAGAPNSANPAGGRNVGPSIADLNKMAADPNLSPRARAEKMRALQTG